VPAEGENGVFSQSWFPLCLSEQITARQVRGEKFLAVLRSCFGCDSLSLLMHRTINEDKEILNTIHYRPGTLTRGERTLAQDLQFLRRYPRAHPSASFIN
jgi:hypothetical protein